MFFVSYVAMAEHDYLTVAFAVSQLPFLGLVVLLRRLEKQKRSLVRQLRDFDVRDAQCSEARDREFILKSICDWYGDLDAFNSQVHHEVRRQISRGSSVLNLS